MARRMRRRAAARRLRWILSTAAVVVFVAVAGVWGFVGVGSSGGRAVRARKTPHAVPTNSTTTSSSTTTTTTPPTLPPTPVPIQGGAVAPVISRVPTPNPVVFFTIDDGMVRDPAVVDFLREQHIPVTMFLLPNFLHEDPAYFDSIHALGASVQDHTISHGDLRQLSATAQQREICGVLGEYSFRFGAQPWLFRPPDGFYNQSVPVVARRCGIRAVVMWRATMNDGRLDVQGGGPLQPGDIVLMHFRHDLRQNLEVALNAARAAGLQPAALEQYLTPA
ncbi:MAG TPA: polysaccharide deacetylase family protein [Acidimicrobiia bacterium]|nr:polysaccharide deacetylase family protein [Acidimicrobiia bacterium]